MKRKPLLLLLVLAAALACQVIPTPPALRATPRRATVTALPSTPLPLGTQTSTPLSSTAQPTSLAAPPGELAPISYSGQLPFADVNLTAWSPQPRSSGWPIALPVSLDQVGNRAVTEGLTLRQRNMLSQNGFVIVHSQEAQFNDLRQRVSLFYGQPYFLTSDAAFHAVKITYDELIQALEREELQRRLRAVVQATFDQVQTYFPLVTGTGLEPDVHLAAAYLGVALRLLDPQAVLDPEIEALVAPQVDQIMAAGGPEESRLLPGFQDDYRLYRPSGAYAGDPDLEAYYRGLTWLERVEFPVQEGSLPAGTVNHVPLIVTLALRQAATESGPAAADWVRISETLDFIAGPRQSGGPAEYAQVMDQVYGRMVTVLSLQDASRLETFRSLLAALPFAYLGLPPLSDAQAGNQLQSWSFLGARSEMDDLILRRLAAETPADPEATHLSPGGLELMAVLGAPAAQEAMKSSGAEFRSTSQQITALQKEIQDQSIPRGAVSARELWLEAYRQLLSPEENFSAARPPFAATPAWDYKDLNSALGSWTEQQYATTGFAPEAGTLQQTPESNEAAPASQASPAVPGYVEPNPDLFYQLARLAFTTAEGLKQRDLTGVFTANPDPSGLSRLLVDMLDLADRLGRLGDIASRELAGDPLTPADYALIQAPLGPAEERVMDALEAYQGGIGNSDGIGNSGGTGSSGRTDSAGATLPRVPGVAAFDYGGERILQVGVGGVDHIYALVPLEGGVVVAQGGIYSCYEFEQNRDRPLTEELWRRMLIDAPPEPPGWVKDLYLSEGFPLDVLAYRAGDYLQVLPAAGKLGLRASPSRDARISQLANPGEILKIVDGPIRANGLNWWKVQLEQSSAEPGEAWIYENQEWFARAWYQAEREVP